MLGRTTFLIYIKEEDAYFVLPSKKVFWRGEKQEVIRKFLGFRVDPQEIVYLLSGEWESSLEEDSNVGRREDWMLERDSQNRVVSGDRADLHFEVKEFFAGSESPHIILFESLRNTGRLSVLSINFNQRVKEETFALSFLKDFTSKTWEEIAEMLENEG